MESQTALNDRTLDLPTNISFIMKDFSEDQVDILSSAWSERVWLYKNTKVISEKSCEDRLVFCVNWSIEQKQTFYKKFYQRVNF